MGPLAGRAAEGGRAAGRPPPPALRRPGGAVQAAQVARREHAAARSPPEDPPAPQPQDMGDLGEQLLHPMGDQQELQPAAGQPAQGAAQEAPRGIVQAVERLVQRQQARPAHQRPGHQQAAELSRGKGAEGPGQQGLQLEQPDQLPDPGLLRGVRPAALAPAGRGRELPQQLPGAAGPVQIRAEPARGLQALLPGDEPAVQLVGNPADRRIPRLAGSRSAQRRESPETAADHRHISQDRAQQRGFARPVGPEHGPMLPLPNAPVDIRQDDALAGAQSRLFEGKQHAAGLRSRCGGPT